MKNLFLPPFLVVTLMASMVFAMSTSQSCSCVNGVCTCDSSQDKEGNFAGAASIASTGFGRGPSTYNSAATGSSKTGVVDVQSSHTGDAIPQGWHGGVVAGNPASAFTFGSSVATSNGNNREYSGGPVSSSVAVGTGGFVPNFGGYVGAPGGGISVGVPGSGVSVGGVAVTTPGAAVYVGGFPFGGGFPFAFAVKKK